jgi:hypothetical protein
MKLIIALAAAGLVSSLTAITPATAQKDPACIDKCNREASGARGAMDARSAGFRRSACVQACPAAAGGKKK